MGIIIAVAALGGLTLFLAIMLVVANKKLYVYEDPRIDVVEDMLPHANCGACGLPGCRPFAEALVSGDALPGKCTVSSEEGREAIASYLGVSLGGEEKQVARLACAGGTNVARNKANYHGLSSCQAAALVSGGGKGCFWGCLGFGDCMDVCDFDAIQMDAHSLPVVDIDKCTACGDCVIGDTGATVIAHEGVRDRVTVDVTRDFFGQESTTPALPNAAWPVITFNDEMTLYLNGQTVRLIHAPTAHTDGDTFIYFEEADVLHTGDLMFSGMFPFVDVTSGGTFAGFTAASQAMASLITDETRIIPGHGPLSSKSDIAEIVDMLEGTTAAVQAEIDAGKDIEAILDAAPLTPWVEDWAWGFIDEARFTRLIYADLGSAEETGSE